MRRALRGRLRSRRRTLGALPNDKNPAVGRDEPDDHGVGRSRGGLSTKAHALVDGKGRLLTLIVGPGQAGDSPALPLLLGELRVARRGPGRPRTTPDVLRADRAHCSRGHRALLRARGIKAVIPEKTARLRTANDAAATAAVRSPTTPRTTRTATSSNDSSTA